MQALTRILSISLFAALFQSCGNYDSFSHGASDENPSYEWWQGERESRNKSMESFLKEQSGNFQSFTDTPVGFAGIPVIMFQSFPVIFPDIWNEEEIRKLGFRASDDPEAFLPFGLSWGMSPTPLSFLISAQELETLKSLPGPDAVPDLANAKMQVVNLSCAGCHNGRVMVDGVEKFMVGAPSTTFDINAYRRKVVQTVLDPRYKIENFKSAIEKIGPQNIYKSKKYLAQSLIDAAAFQAKGPLFLGALKAKTLEQEDKIINFLGSFSYRESAHLLLGGTRGQADAFGIGTARILPNSIKDLPAEELTATLAKYLPTDGAMIDYAAIWNQRSKPYSQWDGSITSPFIRNLAPAIGVIGDPLLVNVSNTKKTTEFVKDLPSPAYPFDIDGNKLALGQSIFEKACAECHNGYGFMPLDKVGTDSARAAGFMKMTRELLLGDIKKICDLNLQADPACALENVDRILIPTYNRPGYLAPVLDGIWARAPYLHNGSVPTLHHLLVPSERPKSFVRGNIDYDQKKVGFVWDQTSQYSAWYYTSELGWSSSGHADKDVFFGGIDFQEEPESLSALLEYLKTL